MLIVRVLCAQVAKKQTKAKQKQTSSLNQTLRSKAVSYCYYCFDCILACVRRRTSRHGLAIRQMAVGVMCNKNACVTIARLPRWLFNISLGLCAKTTAKATYSLNVYHCNMKQEFAGRLNSAPQP